MDPIVYDLPLIVAIGIAHAMLATQCKGRPTTLCIHLVYIESQEQLAKAMYIYTLSRLPEVPWRTVCTNLLH